MLGQNRAKNPKNKFHLFRGGVNSSEIAPPTVSFNLHDCTTARAAFAVVFPSLPRRSRRRTVFSVNISNDHIRFADTVVWSS